MGGPVKLRGRLAARPVVAAGFSVLFGIAILKLGQKDARWLVFATGGTLIAAAAALFGLELILTATFVVGLSVDANYYLTQPLPMLYTGMTTPGALYIQLSMLPGAVLFARQVLLSHTGGARLDWAPALSAPMTWVLVVSLASMAASSIRFAGFCVIWQMASLYALFIVTVNLVRSRRSAARVTTLLLVALGGQCVVFLIQVLTGFDFSAVGQIRRSAGEGGLLLHSASGTAASTTAGFAMFLDPLVMLAYALYRTQPASFWKRTLGGLFFLGLTVLALTLNRSTWLAIPLGIGMIEWLLRRRGLVHRSARRRRGPALTLIATFAIFMLAAPLFQSVRHAKHGDDFQQRLDLMKPAWAMIKSNPALGVGPGAYAYVLRQYATGYSTWLYVAHNDYLLIWAERGTLGIVAWAVFLRAVGREFAATSRRRNDWDATVGVGALAGFAMQLWEVFWSAAMPFPSYGVIYVILGVCAGLNHHVLIEDTELVAQ